MLSSSYSEYENAARDAAAFEPRGELLGPTFPHPYGDGSSPFFYSLLGVLPALDELTLDFTKALVVAEGLGHGPGTDYLAVSFSATDYVGHLFGPSSLEAEDNLLRLDRVLAHLFAFLDAQLGRANGDRVGVRMRRRGEQQHEDRTEEEGRHDGANVFAIGSHRRRCTQSGDQPLRSSA